MDNNNSGRGRGRPPAEIPTMPVFLGASRSRKQMQVIMSGPIARELELYIDWASGIAMMPDDEVLIRVMDHALAECFRSDRRWQKEKADFMAGDARQPRPTSTATSMPAPGPRADANGSAPAATSVAEKAPRPAPPTGAGQKAS